MSPRYVVPTLQPHTRGWWPPGVNPPSSLRVGGVRGLDRVLDLAQGHVVQRGVLRADERESLVLLGTVGVHQDDLAGLELGVEDLLGQDVLDVALDRATQRARAEHRVVALLGEQRLG